MQEKCIPNKPLYRYTGDWTTDSEEGKEEEKS